MTAERYAMAHAIVCWIYNTSGVRFAEQIYGADHHPNYLAEKARTWSESPTRAIGALDDEHFGRVAEAAWAKYGEQGLERARLATGGVS